MRAEGGRASTDTASAPAVGRRLRSGRAEPEQVLLASVTRSSVQELGLAAGVGVVASVKTTAIHVLER